MKDPVIHLLYWLAIVVTLLIASLSNRFASVDGLAEKISFALSFASLLLAVIAIFQSIVGGSALNQSTGEMREAAKTTNKAAERITVATDTLINQLGRIPDTLGEMREHVAKIDQRTELWLKRSPRKPKGSKEPPKTDPPFSSTTNGGNMAMMMLALSRDHNRKFNVDDVLGDEGFLPPYVNGYLAAVVASGTLGVTFEDGEFCVTDIGANDAASREAMIRDGFADKEQATRDNVAADILRAKTYFEGPKQEEASRA
jgi:hypothetical protein